MVDTLPITFDGHGGANAPHFFKFCRRDDLCLELDDLSHAEDFDVSEIRSAGDVFLITRHYMSDAKISQAVAVLQERPRAVDVQPRGVRPRTPRSK